MDSWCQASERAEPRPDSLVGAAWPRRVHSPCHDDDFVVESESLYDRSRSVRMSEKKALRAARERKTPPTDSAEAAKIGASSATPTSTAATDFECRAGHDQAAPTAPLVRHILAHPVSRLSRRIARDAGGLGIAPDDR